MRHGVSISKGHKNKQELLRGDAQIHFLFTVMAITPKHDADTEHATKSNLNANNYGNGKIHTAVIFTVFVVQSLCANMDREYMINQFLQGDIL